jgi:hypothetical protein
MTEAGVRCSLRHSRPRQLKPQVGHLDRHDLPFSFVAHAQFTYQSSSVHRTSSLGW